MLSLLVEVTLPFSRVSLYHFSLFHLTIFAAAWGRESGRVPRSIGLHHFVEVDDDNPWGLSLNEYDPGISTEAWLQLLQEPGLLDPDYGIVLRRWYEYGSPCTPSEISEECGGMSARVYQIKLATIGSRALKLD